MLANQLLKLHEKKNPYRIYDYPIKLPDLKNAFKRLNKELFNGKLPDVRLKWAPLAKNFYGKYHHTYNDDGSAKDRLITMATVLQNDGERFEDTLIHEMIHAYQWYMNEKTGDIKYLDDEGFGSKEWFFNPEKDKHKRGHGKTFHAEMNRINKLGYHVTVAGDMQVEKELVKPVYAIIFSSDTERGVFVYSVSDPSNHINDIIASLEEVAGSGFFTSYSIIKTTDTVANTGLRLTKSFELPKNSVNIYVDSERVVHYLANSKLSTVVGGDSVSNKSNSVLEPEDVQLIQKIHKFRYSDFDSYLNTFIGNSNRFAGVRHVRYDWKYGDEVIGVPKPVVDALYNDWLNVSDVELKKLFKYSTSGLYQPIRNNTKPSDKYIKDHKNTYDKNKDRVSLERFKNVYYKVVLSNLKKQAKKYKEDFNEKDIKNVISNLLKDTLLEGYKMNLSEQYMNMGLNEATDDQRKAEKLASSITKAIDTILNSSFRASKLKEPEIGNHFILDTKGKPVSAAKFKRDFEDFISKYPSLKTF